MVAKKKSKGVPITSDQSTFDVFFDAFQAWYQEHRLGIGMALIVIFFGILFATVLSEILA